MAVRPISDASDVLLGKAGGTGEYIVPRIVSTLGTSRSSLGHPSRVAKLGNLDLYLEVA